MSVAPSSFVISWMFGRFAPQSVLLQRLDLRSLSHGTAQDASAWPTHLRTIILSMLHVLCALGQEFRNTGSLQDSDKEECCSMLFRHGCLSSVVCAQSEKCELDEGFEVRP